MIERIVANGLELAVIVRAVHSDPGIRFFTTPEATLQVGQMLRPAGYSIAPHVHKPVAREVSYTQEVLFVRSGRVRVDFYDEQRRYLESREIAAGDVILLARGGHGFHMLENSEIVEVKQGPYVGEHDKNRFEHAPAAGVN
jgi:mannose-6-phosphate isomerase-like protein (cupin superfamily)